MRRASSSLALARRAGAARVGKPRPVAARAVAFRGRLTAFVARHVDGRVAVLVARALVGVSARRTMLVRADAKGRVTEVALTPELTLGRGLPRLLAPLRAQGFRVRRVRPADARRVLGGLGTSGRVRADGLSAALELCKPAPARLRS